MKIITYRNRYYSKNGLWTWFFRGEKHDDIVDFLESLTPQFPFRVLNWLVRKFGRKDKYIIEPFDTFCVDTSLAFIIHPMLVQLKANMHGIPCDFVNERDSTMFTIKQLDMFPEEEKAAYDGASVKEWNDVLDAMIFSFEMIIKDCSDEVYWQPYYEDCEPRPMFSGRMTTKAINSDKYFEFHTKVQRGLELFGKHYMSLWD